MHRLWLWASFSFNNSYLLNGRAPLIRQIIIMPSFLIVCLHLLHGYIFFFSPPPPINFQFKNTIVAHDLSSLCAIQLWLGLHEFCVIFREPFSLAYGIRRDFSYNQIPIAKCMSGKLGPRQADRRNYMSIIKVNTIIFFGSESAASGSSLSYSVIILIFSVCTFCHRFFL